jgi:hypothetical protein
MRQFYLLLTFVCASFQCFSQVSVTATAGTAGPSAYATLKAAFDAINAGTHQGVINILLAGNTNEVAPAVLNASSTPSSYTAINIKPTGGGSRTVSGLIDGPLIDLNGADNVVIDGLNTGGNQLIIANTNTANTNNNSTIRFVNDASSNTIKNCTLQGASTSLTLGTILFGTGTVTGNINNLITTCDITDLSGIYPVNAIYSVGNTSAGFENSGNTISNNNISNFFSADLATTAISLAAGNTSWTISNNKFFQTAARTFTTANTHRWIQITAGKSYTISGNVMGYASAAATGVYQLGGSVATKFVGIDLAVGTSGTTNLQGNLITAFTLNTTSNAGNPIGIWCGINITSGDVNVGSTTGNTFGATTGTGSITMIPLAAGTYVVPINSSSTGIITISNNNFGGISLTPTGVLSGNINCIQTSGASGTVSIFNNAIGNSTPDNILIGAAGTTTGNGILRGILTSNAGSVNINNNTIRNLTHYSNNALALFRALEYQGGTGTISGNSINNITAYGTSVSASTPEGAGMLISTTATGLVITQNTIFNLNVTNATTASGSVVYGIYLGNTTNGVTISRNLIYGLTNASTSTSTTLPGVIAGIYCRDANAANPLTIANNMISLGSGQSTNTAIIGIWNQYVTAQNFTCKVYYNTINIEGAAAAGAQPTFGYLRGDFSTTSFTTPTVDIKNNIFTNNRSGGTGKHYAIGNAYNAVSSSTGWAANASDYNILNANASTIGYWSGDQDMLGWQNASVGDAHSYAGVNVTYINPASDLHLVTTANAAADGKATPLVGFTTDYDNDVRNATAPDLGADEFVRVLAIGMEYFSAKKKGNVNALDWKASCSSTSVKFEIERSTNARNFASIGAILATQARCAQPFDFADNSPAKGTNYYRLKMTEIDGKVSYSTIVAVINKESGFEIVGFTPTLVQRNATLNISSAKNTNLSLVITSMDGKIAHKQTIFVSAGSGMLSLNLSNLSSGAYTLSGYTDEGLIGITRFIKQ